MEKTQIETNMLGRRVQRTDLSKPEEGVVVGAWLQSVIEGRDYPYRDGYRVTRVYFLLESDDGSFSECKAIHTKACSAKIA